MTKILLADDEQSVRQLLELVLRGQGYEVSAVQNGDQLVRMAQETVPDLVLVDLMMPGLDGYEVIRQLRNDTRTAHLPMLILTARSTPNDVVIGFESGADDYIIKPFNIPELLARIKGHLRRASQRPVRNPLTDLPGNVLLTEEVKYRIKRPEPFAYLYLDLDNFKAFNDTYGPARGDRVIKLLAEIIVEVVRSYGTNNDFIGHIGGDDFVALTSPDVYETICRNIIDRFDQRVRGLYDQNDLVRNYLQGIDRQGIPRRFPIITLSIGVVDSRNRAFANYEEISRIAAEMKQFAKQQPESSFALDVRGTGHQPIIEDRRGKPQPALLLITADGELHDTLYPALKQDGYRTLEAPGIPEAHALLAYEFDLALVVADARLGDPLWELADTLIQELPDVALIVLSPRAEDEQIATAHGARAFIQQPCDIQHIISCIAQFAQRGE